MVSLLSHVAILVPSTERTVAVCRSWGYVAGPIDEFPSEGTREVYVGSPDDEGLLLLLEAVGPGPYRRALEKRGPGVHHVAVSVGSIQDYIGGLTGSGWLLHPESLRTLAGQKTVWLARPGLRVLIEVQEAAGGSPSSTTPRFVSEVSLEGEPEHRPLLDALGVSGLRLVDHGGAELVIAGRRIVVADLTSS